MKEKDLFCRAIESGQFLALTSIRDVCGRLPRFAFTALVCMAAIVLTSCTDAQIGNIISSDLSGYADDEDSTNPRDTYVGPQNAEDLETKASSAPPKFNEVSGNADAVPRDPGAPTVTGDAAVGASRNKVTSEFTVKKNGNFTFDIDLKVEDVELIHDGEVFISVRANMLDAQGHTLPATINSGLASVDFEIQRDGQNPHKVIIGGDTQNPDQATAGGDYERTLSGPNQGIQLSVGSYRLELSLNIRAEAPVQVGTDGRKHEAHVKNATATIKLR